MLQGGRHSYIRSTHHQPDRRRTGWGKRPGGVSLASLLHSHSKVLVTPTGTSPTGSWTRSSSRGNRTLQITKATMAQTRAHGALIHHLSTISRLMPTKTSIREACLLGCGGVHGQQFTPSLTHGSKTWIVSSNFKSKHGIRANPLHFTARFVSFLLLNQIEYPHRDLLDLVLNWVLYLILNLPSTKHSLYAQIVYVSCSL